MTIEQAGLNLARQFREMEMHVSVGIGDCELILYKVSKVTPPLLKSLEADGYEGYPCRIVFTGRMRLATQTED